MVHIHVSTVESGLTDTYSEILLLTFQKGHTFPLVNLNSFIQRPVNVDN